MFIDSQSWLTLKIKCLQDGLQQKVLPVLRDTFTREKIGEKVLHEVGTLGSKRSPLEANELVVNLIVQAAYSGR